MTTNLGAPPSSLAQLVDAYKARRGLSEGAAAERLGVSRMTLNVWRREGLRALPTRDRLQVVATVTDTPYAVVLDTALAECGYLDAPPAGDTVSLDGVVAVSRIIAGVIRRGLSPTESSRLRVAWSSASPRTLESVAHQVDGETPRSGG